MTHRLYTGTSARLSADIKWPVTGQVSIYRGFHLCEFYELLTVVVVVNPLSTALSRLGLSVNDRLTAQQGRLMCGGEVDHKSNSKTIVNYEWQWTALFVVTQIREETFHTGERCVEIPIRTAGE